MGRHQNADVILAWGQPLKTIRSDSSGFMEARKTGAKLVVVDRVHTNRAVADSTLHFVRTDIAFLSRDSLRPRDGALPAGVRKIHRGPFSSRTVRIRDALLRMGSEYEAVSR